MTITTRPTAWMGLGCMLGVLATSAWLHAQAEDTRSTAIQDALRQAQSVPSMERVYSGPDVGFRARMGDGGSTVFVPVVRVKGEWVEVQLGAPGVRFLTKD